jgi:nudix-type nucleoside diphosphatase (YffH/AdpP family)
MLYLKILIRSGGRRLLILVKDGGRMTQQCSERTHVGAHGTRERVEKGQAYVADGDLVAESAEVEEALHEPWLLETRPKWYDESIGIVYAWMCCFCRDTSLATGIEFYGEIVTWRLRAMGILGQACCTSITLAEWRCRAIDRVDPARMRLSWFHPLLSAQPVASLDMKSEIISVETKYKGWARFSVVSVRLPNGQVVHREIEDHGAAVAVLAYDPDRKTAILVQQFRAPPFFSWGQEHTLEAIAGIVEDADCVTAARREALEEAGLHLRSLECVATVWTMPGISTERMTLYLAVYRRVDRIAEGGGVTAEHENISVIEIELCKLAELMDAGELMDMKTLVLAQALKMRHPELFPRKHPP